MYTLLKASDFVVHDLSAESVFEGCVNNDNDDDGHDEPEPEPEHDQDARCESAGGYRLELVLRKWFAIDPSREMRAFVRDGVLIGAWRHLHPSIYIYMSLTRAPRRKTHKKRKRNRHIAARCEPLRVFERARDAEQDRVVLRGALDCARQAKVDRPCIL